MLSTSVAVSDEERPLPVRIQITCLNYHFADSRTDPLGTSYLIGR